MSVVLRPAETMAARRDAMHRAKSFDLPSLVSATKAQSAGRPLLENYRETAFYHTIPIVASWQAADKAAQEQGDDFFTPSSPDVKARIPKNSHGTDSAATFKVFEAGQKEFFFPDTASHAFLLAHPVPLAASCLSYHGEPGISPTKNGKDLFGFPMEGMNISQGISQLTTAFAQIDRLTQANAGKAEQTASVAQQLNAEAGALQQTVNTLHQFVGFAEPSVPARARAPAAPAYFSTVVHITSDNLRQVFPDTCRYHDVGAPRAVRAAHRPSSPASPFPDHE